MTGAQPTPDHANGAAWASWSLFVAALLSRLLWVLWLHPPHDHVFSDMAHYVHRAGLLATGSIEPGTRMMVWQAWGTHTILAIPMLLMGPGRAALEVAGLMWAGFSTGTVVLGHTLARRVLPGPADPTRVHWPALAVGVILLGWFPLLSHTGFFVSETPYACALLATTVSAVELTQTRGDELGARIVARRALRTGLWGAVAFALRPQSIVFFVLALGLAWVERRRASRRGEGHWLDLRAASRIAAPITIVLVISLVRVQVHAGHYGVAENAAMNLTAGRCHNIVTRAWSSSDELDTYLATGEGKPDRRVSLPGFRALGREGPDHPLALRPALGGEAIDLVGYIGEADIHREIRRRCYAATGLWGQLRYSVTNVALLWVVARPWPESSDATAAELLPVAVRSRKLAAVLAPLALIAMGLVLLRWGRDGEGAASALCALQLASLLIVAAVFFGDPRFRVPYDPYALLLIVELVHWLVSSIHRTRCPSVATR